jgi:hypothetical protein
MHSVASASAIMMCALHINRARLYAMASQRLVPAGITLRPGVRHATLPRLPGRSPLSLCTCLASTASVSLRLRHTLTLMHNHTHTHTPLAPLELTLCCLPLCLLPAAGTLASGMVYSFVGSSRVQGFAACFWASVAFAAVSAAVEMLLRDDLGGLMWGRLVLVAPPAAADDAAGGEGSKADVRCSDS